MTCRAGRRRAIATHGKSRGMRRGIPAREMMRERLAWPLALGLIALLAAVGLMIFWPRERSGRLRVEPQVVGRTPRLVGTNTGHWLPTTGMADWLTDSGFNAVRIWASFGRLSAPDGSTGPGVADQAGFERARAAVLAAPRANPYLNWPAYDAAFTTPKTEGNNQYALDFAVGDASAHGFEVVLNVTPLRSESRSGELWPASWAERWAWWAHCFAVAYHLDVERRLAVHYFELDNEPEQRLAGRADAEGGILRALELGADAVRAAAGLGGAQSEVQVLGPVAERPDSPLVPFLLAAAPRTVDVLDYHRSSGDPDFHAAGVLGIRRLEEQQPDARPRPIFVTEWGTVAGRDEPTQDKALPKVGLLDARIARAYALSGADGIFQFKFQRTGGTNRGLVTVSDDADHVIGGPVKGYFAHRMLARAIGGGRDILLTTEPGWPLEPLATRIGPDRYLGTVINPEEGRWRLELDVAPIAPLVDATVRLYDAEHDDAPIATFTRAASPLTVHLPAYSIVQVELQPTAGAGP
jgi:hypothetical protein